MHRLRTNCQTGFSIVELLLVLVFVALIAGTGYYVWRTKTQTDNILSQTNHVTTMPQAGPGASVSDTTCSLGSGHNGHLLSGATQRFAFCAPDGWKLSYSPDGKDLFALAQDMSYAAGQKPAIGMLGGSDTNYPLWIHYGSEKEFTDKAVAPYTKVKPPVSEHRLDITKFLHLTGKDDPVGSGIDFLPQGTQQYLYLVHKDDAVVAVYYYAEPGQTDQSALLDLLVGSIR